MRDDEKERTLRNPPARHPGRRPGIHVLAALSDVRWDLERGPGRVDSHLRGNDNNEGGRQRVHGRGRRVVKK
ncbi:MAG TPA: hypothetical protein ENI62_10685 [Gammaproteobacteria bacterium]|nr:hypothetical protein [Gammaproteobacteria bacterium]